MREDATAYRPGHYTLQNDPAIDARVDQDLHQVCREVLQALGSDVTAILLTGGFGRGEGSVTKRGERVQIINDYDVAIALRGSGWLGSRYVLWRNRRRLGALPQRLAEHLGIKQVDLTLRLPTYFTRGTPLRIENYEVKHGHRVLFGKIDPCDGMPDWRSEDIPAFEATWLFRNRGIGLLMAAAYLQPDGSINEADRQNFLVECSKAQIAMGDAILILARQYHFSYAERLQRIDLFDWTSLPRGESVQRHYREGLHRKLAPDSVPFNLTDAQSLWDDVAGHFESTFRYCEEQRLGRRFHDWLDYEALSKPEDGLEWRRALQMALGAGLGVLRIDVWRTAALSANRSRSVSLVALLLFSRTSSSTTEKYLKRASELIGTVPSVDHMNDWAKMTSRLLLSLHPEGEAGRVARSLSTTAS